MEVLLREWMENYFTEPALVIILAIAFTISVKKKKQYPSLRFMPIYIGMLLLAFIANSLAYIVDDVRNDLDLWGFAHNIDYAFTLVEMLVFSHFYFHATKIRLIKAIILLLGAIFLLVFVSVAMISENFRHGVPETTQARVYTVEGLFLLVIICLYFYQLFTSFSTFNFRKQSSFWISTGLAVFLLCSLPYSLLEIYVRENHVNLSKQLYTIFYVFYCVMFIMIIRAYKCPQEKPV